MDLGAAVQDVALAMQLLELTELGFHLGDLACQLALFFQLDAPGGRLGPGTVLRALPGGPGHNCHLYFDVALQSTGTQ
ncbi:Major facilitator superfamily domain-containing protein 3 [Manis javanica]|nr:Major facilitator superfamily domain-containing protein 3 [Manis javanica]